MPIQSRCACGYVLRADDQYAGRRARCPKCGANVLLVGSAVAAPIADRPTAPASGETIGSQRQDAEEYRPELPVIDATPSKPWQRQSTAEQERGLFRRHFFAVWCCRWALWIAGWALIVTYLLVLLVVAILASVAWAWTDTDLPSFGLLEFLAVLTVTLATLTTGFVLLAASQLLTAWAWSFLRQGLGGQGPIR